MEELDQFKITAVCFLFIISVSSVILNSFCLHVIRTSNQLLKKPSTLFIVNLLVLQLIQGIIVIPSYAMYRAHIGSNLLQRLLCNTFKYSYNVTFYGTCLGVLLTSIDRFLAVYWILTYRKGVTRSRVLHSIVLTWFYVLVLNIIPFLEIGHKDIKPPHVCGDYNPQRSWTILMLCVNTALPYILMILCYKYVVSKVKFYETRARQRNSTSFDVTLDNQDVITIKKKYVAKHKKITKLACILSIAYALLWTPSIIYDGLLHACIKCFPQSYMQSNWFIYVEFIIKYIAFFNALAAPVIYCFYQKEFRKSANLHRSAPSEGENAKLIPSDV